MLPVLHTNRTGTGYKSANSRLGSRSTGLPGHASAHSTASASTAGLPEGAAATRAHLAMHVLSCSASDHAIARSVVRRLALLAGFAQLH